MALAHGGVELTRFRGYLITWRSTVHGTGVAPPKLERVPPSTPCAEAAKGGLPAAEGPVPHEPASFQTGEPSRRCEW